MDEDAITRALARKLRIPDKEAGSIMAAISEYVLSSLRGQQEVQINGFGTFGVRLNPQRRTHNPKNRRWYIRERYLGAYFKPTKVLKEAALNCRAIAFDKLERALKLKNRNPALADDPEFQAQIDTLKHQAFHSDRGEISSCEECVKVEVKSGVKPRSRRAKKVGAVSVAKTQEESNERRTPPTASQEGTQPNGVAKAGSPVHRRATRRLCRWSPERPPNVPRCPRSR
jgi:nucleoid DNA-binding protein